VSKYMNGTRSTTYHLHFNVRQRIQVGSKVLEAYVPPYTSLIAAYRRNKGLDAGIDADGNLTADPLLEIGAVAQAPPPAPAPRPAPPAGGPAAPGPAPGGGGPAAPTAAPPPPRPAPRAGANAGPARTGATRTGDRAAADTAPRRAAGARTAAHA